MRLNELEIKIAIGSEENFEKTYSLCVQSFGPPISHLKQLDEYFDTPDGQLKAQDLVVRIRSHGDRQTIALKSPRVELPSGMTNRIELEFLAAEGEQVHTQLLKKGLTPNEAAEKERWTFVYHDCEIVLDRLPFIGSFIEIEGPSEEAINNIASMLQLTSHKIISQNYGELMKAKFLELQLPLTNIHATFAKEKEILNIEK